MSATKAATRSFRPRTLGILALGAGSSIWLYQNSGAKEKKAKHLNPSNFTPYTLVSKEAVSSTSSLFRLRPQHKDDASAVAIKEAFKTGIWSVQFKQPQLQIARNYTPLPDPDGQLADDELQVLIRREEGGEVSNYLHDLPERSTISIRGPFLECELPEQVTNILFLAGGTGIAPALQVANFLRHRKDMNMHILWANRRREDCLGGNGEAPISTQSNTSWFSLGKPAAAKEPTSSKKGRVVELLSSLQTDTKGLEVNYFVDEEKTFISPADVFRLLKEMPLKADSALKGKSVVFISGPEGFLEHWAGKKEWAMGREVQGALGGQLAKMDTSNWVVYKV